MEKVLISELMRDDSTLMHFNPNHDALGRFASSSGVAIRSSVSKIKSKSVKLKEGAANSSKKVKTAVADIKKSRKQKQEEVKSQRISDEKTARERKLKAAEVVKSGNAKLIYENRADLTDKQLQDAINRIGTEARLKELVAYQNPSKMQQLAKTVDKVKPLLDTAETGINAYNQVARVANAFLGENETGRKNTLPYIGKPQNSYNKAGEISSDNRDFITKATKISDLMNAVDKLNPAEAKLAISKAASIEQLRKYAEAEKAYNKAQSEANSSKNDVSFDVSVEPNNKTYSKNIKKGSIDELKSHGYKVDKDLYGYRKDGALWTNDRDTWEKLNPFYDVSPEPGKAFRERTQSERSDYLKKSLSDISKGDTSYKKTAQEKADKKRFDDYFESEVKKEKERQKKNKK